MRNERFDQAVTDILKFDTTYPREAYELLPVALDYTLRRRQRAHFHPMDENQHVTGQQLAEGFRDYMLEEYGPFAWDLLQLYHIRKTDDIGCLVYNLIRVGAFGKTEKDSIEDFHNVYDFTCAFHDPFLPKDVL